jgi:hypothetical protein
MSPYPESQNFPQSGAISVAHWGVYDPDVQVYLYGALSEKPLSETLIP